MIENERFKTIKKQNKTLDALALEGESGRKEDRLFRLTALV